MSRLTLEIINSRSPCKKRYICHLPLSRILEGRFGNPTDQACFDETNIIRQLINLVVGNNEPYRDRHLKDVQAWVRISDICGVRQRSQLPASLLFYCFDVNKGPLSNPQISQHRFQYFTYSNNTTSIVMRPIRLFNW